jgi:hypothetical protein
VVLRAVQIPFGGSNAFWSISPRTGSLILHKENPARTTEFPSLVARCLVGCIDPFTLKRELPPATISLSESIHYQCKKKLANIVRLSKVSFFLTRTYAGYHHNLFNRSSDAFFWLNSRTDLFAESDCLQRSLFVAKTSKSFKERGVLFVGVFLPTYQMHAWIIEESVQPDETDRLWINYRPLLAMFSSSP